MFRTSLFLMLTSMAGVVAAQTQDPLAAAPVQYDDGPAPQQAADNYDNAQQPNDNTVMDCGLDDQGRPLACQDDRSRLHAGRRDRTGRRRAAVRAGLLRVRRLRILPAVSLLRGREPVAVVLLAGLRLGLGRMGLGLGLAGDQHRLRLGLARWRLASRMARRGTTATRGTVTIISTVRGAMTVMAITRTTIATTDTTAVSPDRGAASRSFATSRNVNAERGFGNVQGARNFNGAQSRSFGANREGCEQLQRRQSFRRQPRVRCRRLRTIRARADSTTRSRSIAATGRRRTVRSSAARTKACAAARSPIASIRRPCAGRPRSTTASYSGYDAKLAHERDDDPLVPVAQRSYAPQQRSFSRLSGLRAVAIVWPAELFRPSGLFRRTRQLLRRHAAIRRRT